MGMQDRVAERRMGLPRKRKEGEEDRMERAESSVRAGPETRLGEEEGKPRGASRSESGPGMEKLRLARE